MIKLNMYQEARLDVLKVFYRYHRMSKSELCNSSINKDLDNIFKKWNTLTEVKMAKKEMKKTIKSVGKSNLTEDLLYEIYRDCLEDMIHSLYISDIIGRTDRNIKFCKEMKKAQDRYFNDCY